jgi:hypothetical protein
LIPIEQPAYAGRSPPTDPVPFPQRLAIRHAHSLTLLSFGSEFGPGSSRNRPSRQPPAP